MEEDVRIVFVFAFVYLFVFVLFVFVLFCFVFVFCQLLFLRRCLAYFSEIKSIRVQFPILQNASSVFMFQAKTSMTLMESSAGSLMEATLFVKCLDNLYNELICLYNYIIKCK